MDPNEILDEFYLCLEEEDYGAACDMLQDLQVWIKKGGHTPTRVTVEGGMSAMWALACPTCNGEPGPYCPQCPECHGHPEEAYERYLDRYYGGDTPMTLEEQAAEARKLK